MACALMLGVQLCSSRYRQEIKFMRYAKPSEAGGESFEQTEARSVQNKKQIKFYCANF